MRFRHALQEVPQVVSVPILEEVATVWPDRIASLPKDDMNSLPLMTVSLATIRPDIMKV